MQKVRGQLAAGVVQDVLRHVRLLGDSGRLTLLSPAGRGVVVVRDGLPVHAACRRPDGSAAQGIEALAMMLTWPRGSYVFDWAEEALDARSGRAHEDENETSGIARLSGETEEILERAQAVAAGHSPHGGVNGKPSGRNGTARLNLQRLSAAIETSPSRAPNPAERAGGDPTRVASRSLAGRDPATMVLHRAEIVQPDGVVTVSRGALALWCRLDGATPLSAMSEALGEGVASLRARAEELARAGLAYVAPEPVYDGEFVAGVVDIVNWIMGPMGEIVVQDALDELGLDPSAIPHDRADDLVSSLALHLQRSDWQMKLRARVARLRADLEHG